MASENRWPIDMPLFFGGIETTQHVQRAPVN
jgi:hypothetical protein